MKSTVILSGGVDSSTLLYEVVKKLGASNVIALSFDYGSKHNEIEIPLASKTCKKLKVQHEVIDVKEIFNHFDSALLKHDDSENIPQGHYAEGNMVKTVVPFRNGILLSMAIGFAESIEANKVYYGAHAGDHDIYPDCRKTFALAMSLAAQLGTYNNIEIVASYENENKTTIIEKGKELGVDYSLTWTCYDPQQGGVPCGKCGSCVERTEAMVNNQLVDPIFKDEQSWNEAVDYMKEVTKKV